MNETEHDRRRDDIAAYLLGAMEPGEAAELERHVAGCPECEQELQRLRPAVRVLPETVERVEPPAELRARLIARGIKTCLGIATAPVAKPALDSGPNLPPARKLARREAELVDSIIARALRLFPISLAGDA